MPEASLVPAGNRAAVLLGLDLPPEPPTRVYISGRTYRLSATPNIALPPIANVVRFILNWAGPAGRVAKNIGYLLTGGGFVSSDPVSLKTLADQLMTQTTAAGIATTVHTNWTLQSITCRDAGGTTAQATSTVSPIAGLVSGTCLSPSVALCASWQIAEAYRGGKPRWYIPGVSDTAVSPSGSSSVTSSFATTMEAHFTTLMNDFNGIATSPSGTFKLGTVSYHSGHAVRPSPIFRQFINVKVHQRLDSQRRRSGSESGFGVIP